MISQSGASIPSLYPLPNEVEDGRFWRRPGWPSFVFYVPEYISETHGMMSFISPHASLRPGGGGRFDGGGVDLTEGYDF